MPTIVIGTAGHVDHGKSALVKALTGTDPDRLKEERARGITIDLGFAFLREHGTDLAFVDVPGHERFVRNMLAGAGGIDAVLLVVAADEGVRPQTREHFEICRLLALPAGIVAVTKSDLADAARREATHRELSALLAGSALQDAPRFDVSARTGEGLEPLRRALVALAGLPARLARPGLTRLPIDRVFSVKGFGTVVTGTLVSGRVADGDALVALPAGVPVRVRGVQTHGARVAEAEATARVAVNVVGADESVLLRGATLATAGALSVTRALDVRLECLSSAPPLRHGAVVRVHLGTGSTMARVRIAAVQPAGSQDWIPAASGDAEVAAAPGDVTLARLRLQQPLACARGDRLVVRGGTPFGTLAGGVVLDAEPRSPGLRRPGAIARFEALADPARATAVWLADAAGRGIGRADLVRRLGESAESAEQVVAGLVGRGEVLVAGGRAWMADTAARAERELLRRVAAYHAAHPAEAGVPSEALRTGLAQLATPDLVDAILEGARRGGLVRGADRVALAGHRVEESDAAVRLRHAVEAELRAGGLSPPDLIAIAQSARAATGDVDQALRRLARDGIAISAGDIWFHRDSLAGLKAKVRALAGTGPAQTAILDVASFKAMLGVTRKYAIPLLEWLDRERVTRRVGDRRVVL
jgi:selenocysteine-specific elongation factor